MTQTNKSNEFSYIDRSNLDPFVEVFDLQFLPSTSVFLHKVFLCFIT